MPTKYLSDQNFVIIIIKLILLDSAWPIYRLISEYQHVITTFKLILKLNRVTALISKIQPSSTSCLSGSSFYLFFYVFFATDLGKSVKIICATTTPLSDKEKCYHHMLNLIINSTYLLYNSNNRQTKRIFKMGNKLRFEIVMS